MKTNEAAQDYSQNIDYIGLYNKKVEEYLSNHPLTELQQVAIKHFKDNAQKSKLSDKAYNKAVEEFNKLGYILRKKSIKQQFPEIDKNYNYINFPYIDKEAFKETMRNYRQYVHEYNDQAKDYNKKVSNYNTNYQLTKKAALKDEIKRFKSRNKRLFTRSYNLKVIEFNAANKGVYIKQKKIQTIKYATELVFQVVLGFYTKQLRNYTNTRLKAGQSTSMLKNSLKRVEIDHRKLANHKIDDIPRLGICKKTAQNHIKRLREAGLLTHYVYSNQFHAIKVCINTKILVVFDGNLPKHQNTENQNVKPVKGKKLPDNSDTTRTYLKEKEKKDDVFNIGQLISGSMLQSLEKSPAVSYKNTRRKTTEKTNVSERISLNARKLLLDDRDFAKNLHENVYDNYTVLRYDRLLRAAQYSDLTSSEFKKLLIQDFIKQSAKIWKNHSVYEGEWKKTINLLNANLFKNITQKETMVQKLGEYRWKIDFARRWFIKNPISALFPYQYFNPTRKTTNEIGFYGLNYAWKSHLTYLKNKNNEEKNLKIEANKRKRKISDDKKMKTILQKFYTGKINFERMYDYINHNLPPMYMEKLVKMFKNYNKITA